MNKEQFKAITQWQQETFPNGSATSKIARLAEELQELIEAIIMNKPDKRHEFADCFLLLFGAADSDGMSYDDILLAIQEKHEINKCRKWGKPDENGVVRHIKE